MNPEELVDTYCLAWTHPSPGERAGLLERVWAPGARYTDPSVDLEGADALLAHIARVQARRPGSQVVRTTVVDVHDGLARFGWCVVDPQGHRSPEELDFAEIGPSGKLLRIVGFFGPLAAR
jgi:hypothetical protein